MTGHPTTIDEPGGDAAADDAAARERLEVLFVTFDRLTPDELGRIGLGQWEAEEHEDLLDAVDVAAAQTGREALVAEAREAARDAVLRRYSAGTLHATWIALNWGLSQGRVEDRVAIVETLADAAAATVVADVLDPDVYEALTLPAGDLVAMSTGMASEGALGRQMAVPADPELGPSQRGRWARLAAVGLLGASVVGGYIAAALALIGLQNSLLAFVLMAAASVGLVVAVARR
jgi:hypothetical protein